jgi:choline dehydrogenase-like flavoprotein
MSRKVLSILSEWDFWGRRIDGPLEALTKHGCEVVFATSKGRQAQPLLHEIKSCRIGTDDQAVVDPQLRVHGVTGLRVVPV